MHPGFDQPSFINSKQDNFHLLLMTLLEKPLCDRKKIDLIRSTHFTTIPSTINFVNKVAVFGV